MRLTYRLLLLATVIAFLLAACIHPISREVREQVAQETTFAMVSESPRAFLDQHLLVGGVIVATEGVDEGTLLEIMEWRLNRWGEPTYLEDEGRRFLFKSNSFLDPTIYEPGVLVTLAGVVLGYETRLLGEHEYNYPVFDLTEIHLWESPFRYGIHRNINPAYPYYVGGDEYSSRNPYDPGYSLFPYTQHWHRGTYPSIQ